MVITKGKKQSKMVHYLLAPLRILSSARDFYTNTLCDCAGRMSRGSAIAGYTALPQMSQYPRNHSGTSSMKENKDIEDLRKLIREMTIRNSVGNRVEPDSKRKLRATVEGGASGRSYSLGVGRIGRIDEDSPCDFVEVVNVNKNMYPRCGIGTYAVTNRNVAF